VQKVVFVLALEFWTSQNLHDEMCDMHQCIPRCVCIHDHWMDSENQLSFRLFFDCLPAIWLWHADLDGGSKKKSADLKVFKNPVCRTLAIMLYACCMHHPGENGGNPLSFRIFFDQGRPPHGTLANLHTPCSVNRRGG